MILRPAAWAEPPLVPITPDPKTAAAAGVLETVDEALKWWQLYAMGANPIEQSYALWSLNHTMLEPQMAVDYLKQVTTGSWPSPTADVGDACHT